MQLERLITNNKRLFKNEYLRFYKQGTYMCRQEDPLDYIFFVLQGSGWITKIDEQGRERIFNYFRQGDCAGKAVFTDEKEYSEFGFHEAMGLNIIAKTDCKAYRISLKECYDFAKKSSDFFHYFISKFSRESFQARKELFMLRENKTANILCNFLFHNVSMKEEIHVIDKWFNYEELNSLLGIHSVTSSRIIGALIRQEVISKGPKCFYIHDMEQLKRYARGVDVLPYYEGKASRV